MKSSQLSLVAAILVAVAVGTGCSAVRGDKQRVEFESDPRTVHVLLNGQSRVTPFAEDLKRRDKYTVVADAQGYQPVEFEFYGRVDTAAALPFALPGGSVMMAADAATGANKDFSKKVIIKLAPATRPTTQPVVVKEWRGVLYTPDAYEAQIKAELEAIKESTPVNGKRPVKGFGT